MFAQLGPFLVVAIVIIVTPGQDTALTIRNTLVGGRRSGIFTAMGVSTGQACWTVAVSLGIAAVLTSSEAAFSALKIVGAGYLAFLGIQALVSAVRGREAPLTHPAAPFRSRRDAAAFRQGLISNLGNPKMAIFFTSLLPQFAGSEATVPELLALGFINCALTWTWLSIYAVAIARAEAFIRRGPIRRILDALTGVALVSLGLRLALEKR